MPVPSLLIVAVWWLPGPQGDTSKRVVEPDVTVATLRSSIYLPCALGPEERDKLAKVRLFVSADRGRTWKMEQEITGRGTFFTFSPPSEGEYWFAIQLVEKRGRRRPEDVAKEPPALKVLLQKDLKTGQESVPPARQPEAMKEPVEQIEEFVSRYHARPSPERVCHFLDLALTKDVLQHPLAILSPHSLDLFGIAIGHMAKGNVKLVRQIESRFAKSPDLGRALLLKCLRVCGDDETVKQLAAWRDDPRYAEHKKSLEAVRLFLADPKRKLPRDLPAKTPEELDYLWADFLVTGEYAPVARILDVLDDPRILKALKDLPSKEPTALQKLAIWSMLSNIEQHPRLAELLRAHQEDRPEPTRRLIRWWLEEMKKES